VSIGGRNGSRRSSQPAGGAFPQEARRDVVDLEHRRVELPDAGEAGRERDLGHRQRRRLDQNAGGPRPLRPREGQRAGAELGGQHPADLARRVAEEGREPGHAGPVDDPVGDQPHRPAGQVGPDVPLG
jgi:hypothetical protein